MCSLLDGTVYALRSLSEMTKNMLYSLCYIDFDNLTMNGCDRLLRITTLI